MKIPIPQNITGVRKRRFIEICVNDVHLKTGDNLMIIPWRILPNLNQLMFIFT